MIRPVRRAVLLALALFVLFVLIRAPLSLATLWLPPSVALKNVEGSLWNGSASAVGVAGMVVQERVEWRFQPRRMLSGELGWALSGRFGEQRSRANLALGAGGAALSEVDVFLPLEPLAALQPKLKALQLGALLHVSAGRLSGSAPATATINVDSAFSALAPQAGALGSYRLAFDAGADGKGRWTLTSAPGLLGAAGQGQFDWRRAQLGGQLVLTPSAPIPGLTPALSQLPRSGNGYLVAF